MGKQILLRKLKKAASGKHGKTLDFSKMDSDWQWRLCNARMMLGEFHDYAGWQYRSAWSTNAWINRPVPGAPMWDGRYTQRLHVLGEQGLGDEILFAQCIPEVMQAVGKVVFESDGRLASIFERSFGVECVARQKLTDERPGMSAWVCIGDLLRLYRTGKVWNGKPYLKPDPKRLREFDWARDHQCLSWKGHHGEYDAAEFADVVGAGIDVQYDATHSTLIQPGIDKRADLEGLLALLSVAKGLVSVSTSVVHLAAALGRPVDLVLAPPYTGPNYDQLQWRWTLRGNKTPWYESVTIYRSLKEYAHLLLRNTRKARRLQGVESRPGLAVERERQSVLSAG